MREHDERDAQIWGEAPPLDGVDQYARESDPFYSKLDDLMEGHIDSTAVGEWRWLESTAELQRVAFGLDPRMAYNNPTEQARSVKENVLAAVVELVEVLNEVKWKYWSHEDPWVRRDRVLKEVVDVHHFTGNMLVALGVTDEEYEEAYQKKQRENIERQRAKYVSAQAEEKE